MLKNLEEDSVELIETRDPLKQILEVNDSDYSPSEWKKKGLSNTSAFNNLSSTSHKGKEGRKYKGKSIFSSQRKAEKINKKSVRMKVQKGKKEEVRKCKL